MKRIWNVKFSPSNYYFPDLVIFCGRKILFQCDVLFLGWSMSPVSCILPEQIVVSAVALELSLNGVMGIVNFSSGQFLSHCVLLLLEIQFIKKKNCRTNSVSKRCYGDDIGRTQWAFKHCCNRGRWTNPSYRCRFSKNAWNIWLAELLLFD